MRKNLLAAAAALAFASASVSAADVQVYGLIDLGLSYVHSDADQPGVDSKDKFTMENATEFGSRFGIKGTEDLGNGYKVGFVLENGFNADDGTLDQGGKLFGRESHIDLHGPFGKLSFGLMPVFGSVLGADGLFRAIDPLFANYTEGFSSGFASASRWTRVDNAISYVTPNFAGFTGYAMYSLKNSSSGVGDEGKASSDRYGALAMRYKGQALEAILVADMTMYGNDRADAVKHDDDGVTVTIGGNYAFDNGFKIITFFQYFKDQELNAAQRGGVALDGINAMMGTYGYGFVDGWGASIGAHYPIAGGTLKGQIAYRDMDNDGYEQAVQAGHNADFTRWTFAVGYDYPLSKRTAVYAMAGYSQEKIEITKGQNKGKDATPGGCEVTVGMVHRF